MENTIIIIPTYNEIENISEIISEAFKLNDSISILIVDDSSPDGTSQKVEILKKKYPNQLFLEVREKKEGIGIAYKHGFKWALKRGYEYIFQMDADFSHNPKEVKPMLEKLKNGFDVVVGSRYVKGINVVNWPLGRVLLSYIASLYVRIITGMPVKDPTAGFVAYQSTILKMFDLDQIKFTGYGFQIEMKYKAWLSKATIYEHSIVFVNRSKGVSKMNGKIIREALFGVLYLRFKNIFC